jgi:uncharacterized membrane protein HdeD (DUF308 family)
MGVEGHRRALVIEAQGLLERLSAVEDQRQWGATAIALSGIAMLVAVVVGVWCDWPSGVFLALLGSFLVFVGLTMLWGRWCHRRQERLIIDLCSFIALARATSK